MKDDDLSKPKKDAGLQQKEDSTSYIEVNKKPSLYNIILINDEETPLDFVKKILEKFIHINEKAASDIAITIHNEGQAICAQYSKDIAETKTLDITRYIKMNKYPLRCIYKKS